MHPLVKAAIFIASTETGRKAIKKGVNWTIDGVKRHPSGKGARFIQQAEDVFKKHAKGKVANIFEAGAKSIAKGENKVKMGAKMLAGLLQRKSNTHS